MISKRVCIVGGGISGLVCAQTLKSMASTIGGKLEILLFEASMRLGGQIDTHTYAVNKETQPVIIEAGAEGFVTRSEVFPRVAEYAGIPQRELVNQARISDFELARVGLGWEVHPLEAGVAAQRLGFQVPNEDRGKGIRSFARGMSQLVDAISPHIDKVSLNSVVTHVKLEPGAVCIEYETNGTTQTTSADFLVLATPLESVRKILPQDLPNLIFPPQLAHNSHVSVHVVTRNVSLRINPSSFAIPEEFQGHFHGLRAVSFVNEKFSGRCSPDSWLFRCYYRPSVIPIHEEAALWEGRAKRMLSDVFGIKEFTWSHYAYWQSALPVLSKEHLKLCEAFKHNATDQMSNKIFLVGSEVSGAGLEAAATSGYDAAVNILKRLDKI